MDGLLIDSEPLWRETEKEIFSKLGVQLTDAMCKDTMGMRVDEVIGHWFKLFPWKGLSFTEVREKIILEMKRLITLNGKAMPGVDEILDLLDKNKIEMAVASSSYLVLIETVLVKLKINKRFKIVHSAEFEANGKPHPEIYLSTARMMSTEPENCIAFEDSYNGILSAKNAGMFTIAVPEPENFDDKRLDLADRKLRSLEEFDQDYFDGL